MLQRFTSQNVFINLTGFHPPLRRDRNRYGGGVALYISNNLHFTYRSDLESTYIEILWAEINAYGKKILVGVLYRPPQSKVEYWDHFQTNVHRAIDLYLPIFLLGDFNVNMLSQQNNSFLAKSN